MTTQRYFFYCQFLYIFFFSINKHEICVCSNCCLNIEKKLHIDSIFVCKINKLTKKKALFFGKIHCRENE